MIIINNYYLITYYFKNMGQILVEFWNMGQIVKRRIV